VRNVGPREGGFVTRRTEPAGNDGGEIRSYDLGERTAQFGETTIDFVLAVKLTPITSPLVSQLVRSATSIGANYCEASEAGSDKEFWYRVSISNREARETKHWLRMLARATPSHKDTIRRLWKEAHELNLIFASIYRKGKRRGRPPSTGDD
jgi:four helix bundle protein